MTVKSIVFSAFFAVSVTAGGFAFAHGVEKPADAKKLQYFPGAQSMELSPMEVPGVAAFFDDVVGSGDPEAPISCGLFRIEKGEPLVYTYDYDDIKIVLEGEINFSDGQQNVTGQPGDVLFFPTGSTITFSTNDSGLAFACGQRPLF